MKKFIDFNKNERIIIDDNMEKLVMIANFIEEEKDYYDQILLVLRDNCEEKVKFKRDKQRLRNFNYIFKYYLMIGDKTMDRVFGTQQENSVNEILSIMEVEIGKQDILIETQLDIEEEEEQIGFDKIEKRYDEWNEKFLS